MALVHDLATTFAIQAYALERGGTPTSPISLAWDVAGNCTSPVFVTLSGRANRRESRAGWRPGQPPISRYVDIKARCRKCPACLRARSYAWSERCFYELLVSAAAGRRVWFTTFTFRPSFHVNALGDMKDPANWSGALKACNREVTLWLKRVRKSAPVRYAIVCEPHKSGAPHFHGLIHELSREDLLTEREQRRCWEAGFLHAKLVNSSQSEGREVSRYLSKYLTKSLRARVRASQDYGYALTA